MTDDFEYFYDLVALSENSDLPNKIGEKSSATNTQQQSANQGRSKLAQDEIEPQVKGITLERITYLVNELQSILAWSSADNPFKISIENTIKYLEKLREEI